MHIDRSKLSDNEHLELLYRTGRVLEGLKDYEGALSFYGQTVTHGRDNPAYFACKSALQAGLVEEQRGTTDWPPNISVPAWISTRRSIGRGCTFWQTLV